MPVNVFDLYTLVTFYSNTVGLGTSYVHRRQCGTRRRPPLHVPAPSILHDPGVHSMAQSRSSEICYGKGRQKIHDMTDQEPWPKK